MDALLEGAEALAAAGFPAVGALLRPKEPLQFIWAWFKVTAILVKVVPHAHGAVPLAKGTVPVHRSMELPGLLLIFLDVLLGLLDSPLVHHIAFSSKRPHAVQGLD